MQAAACTFLYVARCLSRTGPGHLTTTGGAEAGLLEPAGPTPPRVHDWRGREEADTARPREDETTSERAAAGRGAGKRLATEGGDAVCLYWAYSLVLGRDRGCSPGSPGRRSAPAHGPTLAPTLLQSYLGGSSSRSSVPPASSSTCPPSTRGRRGCRVGGGRHWRKGSRGDGVAKGTPIGPLSTTHEPVASPCGMACP